MIRLTIIQDILITKRKMMAVPIINYKFCKTKQLKKKTHFTFSKIPPSAISNRQNRLTPIVARNMTRTAFEISRRIVRYMISNETKQCHLLNPLM